MNSNKMNGGSPWNSQKHIVSQLDPPVHCPGIWYLAGVSIDASFPSLYFVASTYCVLTLLTSFFFNFPLDSLGDLSLSFFFLYGPRLLTPPSFRFCPFLSLVTLDRHTAA